MPCAPVCRGKLLALGLVLGLLPLTSQADQAAPPDKALVVVRVPPLAVVLFDQTPTRQAGPERLYVSPTLTPGKAFTYHITARWNDGGAPKEMTRKVVVRAGQRSVV